MLPIPISRSQQTCRVRGYLEVRIKSHHAEEMWGRALEMQAETCHREETLCPVQVQQANTMWGRNPGQITLFSALKDEDIALIPRATKEGEEVGERGVETG